MFRLGRYRIIFTAGKEVLWQTSGGVNRVAGGPGRIESGLLILGSQEVDEEGPKKRDFLDKLNQLPQWEGTQVWCLESVLQECREPLPPVRLKGQLKDRIARVKRARGKRPDTTQQNRPKESPKRLFTLNRRSFKFYPSSVALAVPFQFQLAETIVALAMGKKILVDWAAPAGLIRTGCWRCGDLPRPGGKGTWSHGHKKHHH